MESQQPLKSSKLFYFVQKNINYKQTHQRNCESLKRIQSNENLLVIKRSFQIVRQEVKMRQKNKIDQKQLKLKKLTQNWSCNKLTMQKLILFEEELKKRENRLKSLTINIRESQIDSELMKMLASSFRKFEIEDHFLMNFISCKIGDFQSISDILISQQRLSQLTLEFGAVNMFDDQISYLCKGIQGYELLNVLSLNLAGCTIKDNGMELLMKAISQYSNLKYLDLDVQRNKLGSDSGNYFSQGIRNCKQITFLKINLFENQAESSNLLPNSIKNMNSLENIKELQIILHEDISFNITDLGFLSQNQINIFTDFCCQLSTMRNIQILKLKAWRDLFNNNTFCISFNSTILQLQQLKVLVLEQFATQTNHNLFTILNEINLHQNLIYLYINTYNLKTKLKQVKDLQKVKRLVKYQD